MKGSELFREFEKYSIQSKNGESIYLSSCPTSKIYSFLDYIYGKRKQKWKRQIELSHVSIPDGNVFNFDFKLQNSFINSITFKWATTSNNEDFDLFYDHYQSLQPKDSIKTSIKIHLPESLDTNYKQLTLIIAN